MVQPDNLDGKGRILKLILEPGKKRRMIIVFSGIGLFAGLLIVLAVTGVFQGNEPVLVVPVQDSDVNGTVGGQVPHKNRYWIIYYLHFCANLNLVILSCIRRQLLL